MKQRNSRPCLWVLLLILVVLGYLGWRGFRWVKVEIGNFEENLTEIKQEVGEQQLQAVGEVMPYFLGLESPKHFLVLLQNNTEMRPTGGFVGAYAVVDVEGGEVKDWIVQGSEVLDNAADTSLLDEANPILQQYLAQDTAYFRDGNWNPDFPTSAQELVRLYQLESGDTRPFDGVIAITPTVLERLMQHIGPVTVDGVTLRADNFTERLEFEVEYGYEQRGDSFANRKELIGEVLQALIERFEDDFLTLWPKVTREFFASLDDKHILLYAADADTQTKITKQHWGGVLELPAGNEDGFAVIDANLASLKTDHAITRSYTYTITKSDLSPTGWMGELAITYDHNGEFNWRTSRYRSYTRVYLPVGAQFLEGEGAHVQDRNPTEGEFVSSQELGRPVVGAFFAVEPGNTHELVIRYALPPGVVEAIDEGVYTLFVQKQPGLHQPSLTLDLLFDKTIVTGDPGEIPEKWGDARYQITHSLIKDQQFVVGFEK